MVKLVPGLLLIAGFFVIANATNNTRISYEQTPLLRYKNKVFYIESNLQLNWYGALHFCKWHNMELASVESLDEHNAIVDYVKAIGRVSYYWIAGNDLEANDVKHYYWANTGQKMNFTMWSVGQPDNALDIENCAHMFFNKNNGAWNDLPCTRTWEFICEMRI